MPRMGIWGWVGIMFAVGVVTQLLFAWWKYSKRHNEETRIITVQMNTEYQPFTPSSQIQKLFNPKLPSLCRITR
jgi:hypothetical protein